MIWRAPHAGCAAMALAMTLVAAGCQMLGPTALGAGRGAYSEVIGRTNSEQLLTTLVNIRYGDPIGLLAVTSVTASLKFGATGGAEFGVGPTSNYSGNLVPLSAGVSYEDNPTISYSPVDGEAFVREWLSPIPIDVVVAALRSSHSDRTLIPLLIGRINELRSPIDGGSQESAERFFRMAALLEELDAEGVARWGSPPGAADRFELVLEDSDPAHRRQLEELLSLLGLEPPAPASDRRQIRLPVVAGVRSPGDRVVDITPCSLSQLLTATAGAIEVPRDHLAEKVVGASPDATKNWSGAARIRCSSSAPSAACIAVRRRGFWFYIDDADLRSKHQFQRLEMLFMMRLNEARHGQTAPVLTIPVG